MANEANKILEKRLNRIAYIVSALVLVLVSTMHMIKLDIGYDTSFLPPVHSSLNAMAAVFLILALYFIKNKNVKRHEQMIYAAMGCSALFLLSYVVYHTTNEPTRFGGQGMIRYIYFFFLNTHIILAGVILPFIFLTFIRAYTNQFERHKKMARWVFPLWLYVAISGPICYLMLRPYYG